MKTLWGMDSSTWKVTADSFFRLELLGSRMPSAAVLGPDEIPAELSEMRDDLIETGDDAPFGFETGELVAYDDMDGLVEPPEAISVPQIDYARTPGYVDVKMVKETMHGSITQLMTEPRRKSAGGTEQPRALPFQDLFGQVQKALPPSEQEGLTVAIAFICALHLCNEHDVELERVQESDVPLGDFRLVLPS